MSNSTPFYAEYGITTADEFRAAINEKAPIKLEPTSGQATELDASTIAYCDSWLRVVFKGEDKQFIFDESNGWSIAEVKRESSGGGEKELPTPASTDAGKLVGVGETGDYEMIDAVYGVKPQETLIADITVVEGQVRYPAPGLDGMEFEEGQEVQIRNVDTYRGKTHEKTCTYAYEIIQEFGGSAYEVLNCFDSEVRYNRELGTEHWFCEFMASEGVELQSYLLSGGQKIPKEYVDLNQNSISVEIYAERMRFSSINITAGTPIDITESAGYDYESVSGKVLTRFIINNNSNYKVLYDSSLPYYGKGGSIEGRTVTILPLKTTTIDRIDYDVVLITQGS